MDAIHEDVSKAISLGQLEKVKDLINRYDVNSSGAYGYYVLLRKSVKLKHTEITTLLLTSGSEETTKRRKIISSNTPLHFAVQDDDLEIIEMLLDQGANINARNECGSSPLLIAIRMGKGKIVDLLLKKGTNLKYYNDGYSPLHLAAEQALFNISEKISSENSKSRETLNVLSFAKENFARVKLSLNRHADDNDRTNNMNSTLYLAVLISHREPTMFLDDHKAKIDAEFENGGTALYCDVCKGLSMIFEDILTQFPGTKNGSKNNFVKTDAGNRLDNNNATVIEKLLEYGFHLSKQRDPLLTQFGLVEYRFLHECERFNELKYAYVAMIHKYFLEMINDASLPRERYKNVNFQIMTKNEQVSIAKLLFEPRHDASSIIGYNGPVLYTLKVSDADLTKIMLLHGPQSNPPFYECACKKQITNVVDIFYEYKAELYCPANDFSPLQIAAYRGDEQTMEILVANGINVNAKRRNGDTALHIVARTYHTNVLKILLKNGADVYSQNEDGDTPLHVASEGDDHKIVHILLQHGSLVNFKNIYGRTPLNTAIDFIKRDILKLLLKFGADISLAMKLANERGRAIYRRLADVLDFHLIMLKSGNLYIDEQNTDLVNDDYDNPVWKQRCEREIQKIKLEKIPNTNLSFYDILTNSMQSLARYARNEDIVRIFESENYKTMFPIYAPILERNLKRALLYERAKEFFYSYFGFPYHCSEQIFQYLKPPDIESLMHGN